MATSNFPSQLAYAFEATPGTGPADAAAWLTAVSSLATGGRLRHVAASLSTDNLKQSMIDDMRSQTDILTQELKVHGIKGGVDFPFDVYLHGTGVTTSATTQAAANALSNLLEHALGGQSRTYSTTQVGAALDTVTITPTATTGIDEGVYLAIQDTTSPSTANTGRAFIRRVIAWDGTDATLDEALPFTPAAGDIVHACIAIHIDQSVQVDSSGAANRTLSWHLERGLSGGTEAWETRGCASQLSGIKLDRNAAPVLSFGTRVGSFLTPEEASDPTWVDTPFGYAPQAVGVRTQLWISDVGDSTSTQFHAVSVAVSPGLERSPIESVTENNVGMPGLALYSIKSQDTTVQIHTVPFSATRYTEFEAGTLKQVRYAKVAAPGSCWALHFPRCQMIETPSSQDADAVMGQQMNFRAMQQASNAAAGSAALWESRMVLIMA